MDAFQQIAYVLEEDCLARLCVLEAAQSVIEHSKTLGDAMRQINLNSEIYTEDYQELQAIGHEIERLRSCICATDVSVSL